MTSMKFDIKQEKTLYYTNHKTNLLPAYDGQSSNEANSGRFMRHPVFAE